MNGMQGFSARRMASMFLALVLVISIPITALADTSATYCAGEAEARQEAQTAIRYGEQTSNIIDVLVGVIMEYDGIFTGSSTGSFIKEIAISILRSMLDDPDSAYFYEELGFDLTDSVKDMLAEEAFYVACIYYDELHRAGGTEVSAKELASIEMIRFVLVEVDKYSNEEAEELSSAYYEIYLTAVTDSKKAAEAKAMALFATPHEYGEPAWIWSEAYDSATATFICMNCTYTQRVSTTDISVETTAPTCTEMGMATYMATAILDSVTAVSEIAVIIPVTHTGDSDRDHICDECGEVVTACLDGDFDHLCDVCAMVLSSCVDEDPEDQLCDICGNVYLKYQLGDVNGDEEIDVFDANLVIAYFYGNVDMADDQFMRADVNGDGEVDVFDANLIVSFFYGTIENFPE